VTLREWDFDRQNYVEVNYPDEIIQRFVNKLRLNRNWWDSPDPGRDVYTAMFRPFQQELADWRAAHPQQPAAPEMTTVPIVHERTVLNGDVGLRNVPHLSGRVLAFALQQGLAPQDFDGVQPAGPGGGYTKTQVEQIVASRSAEPQLAG
jgi:hypothetical protein